MSQFRQNPLTGQWVTIAPARAERPMEFERPAKEDGQTGCPFCEGGEDGTPEEVLALRPAGSRPNTSGWKVRVVPNKYPFVTPQSISLAEVSSDDLFQHHPGQGLQEVIIESPRHVSDVTQLSVDEWTDVLSIYRTRQGQLQADGRWRYALLFKNSGEAAGASLSHIHSQLVALPTIPAGVTAMSDRMADHHRATGRSLLSDLAEHEIDAGERIVCQSEHFVALCPFASRQPYEMQVIPRARAANFAELAEPLLPELAALLRSLIARLESVFNSLAFNWMFHTCPFDTISQEYYHWHVEIVPRVTKTAGYEWATGHAVNIVSPENAAQHLRRLGGTASNEFA